MSYWIDDGIDVCPEVVRAGTAAFGLYCRCGVWISHAIWEGHITAPVIPAEIVAMYGTPEWSAKLVAVGLWRTVPGGFEDVWYHRMRNPTAEKVAAQRKADADRKSRWRANRDASRRDRQRDARVTERVTDAVSPFFPTPPPLKGEGDARPASQGEARVPKHPPHPPTVDQDLERAEREAELHRLAEEGVRQRQADIDLTHRRAAEARQLLATHGLPPTRRTP